MEVPGEKQHKDWQLVQGMLAHDPESLHAIYDRYQAQVVRMVLKNSGTQTQGEDVFQECLLAFYRMAKKESFRLQSALGTLLYAIAYRLWLKQLRKNRREVITDAPGEELTDKADLEAALLLHEKRQLLWRHIEALKADCRKLLSLFYRGHPLQEIAEQMGFTAKYAKVKKFRCARKLDASLVNDPKYRELSEQEPPSGDEEGNA